MAIIRDRNEADKDQIICAYDVSNVLIYVGNAPPGTATSSSDWKIKKLTYDVNGNLTNVTWANGQPTYVNVWDNRASYSYS